jgi:hypothetical protein
MNLGELLVGRGLVTRADIDAALARQLVEGGRLGENLIALGLLTADQLSSVIHSTPATPSTVAETGISQRHLLDLLLKFMHLGSCETAAEVADRMKLPHRVVQQLFDDATHQRFVQALGSARSGLASSIRYSLSDQGRTAAKAAADQNLYVGPAPVYWRPIRNRFNDSELRTKYWTLKVCERASRDLWFPSTTFASFCQR